MASKSYVGKLWWVGAAMLLSAGVITIVVGLFTPMANSSFGWFAYQPLANAIFVRGGPAIVLSPVSVAGWVLFVAGLITFAFLSGRLSGRRSHG